MGNGLPKQPRFLFAETVNRQGGNCTVIHLPETGIKGNTHFPFSDLNNAEIADLLEKFLQEKGLADLSDKNVE